MLLPTPSPRNQEIYNYVRHGGHSLRDAADEFNLSPTRIAEICAQVERWYAATMPDWAAQLNRELAALAAWRSHQERLEQFYAAALEAWQMTKTDITTTRQTDGGATVKRTVPCFGDPRYLNLALRLSLQQCAAATAVAKLPAEWFAKVATDPVPDETAAESDAPAPTTPTEPPTGVCASGTTPPPTSPAPPATPQSVTDDPAATSDVTAATSSCPPRASTPLSPPVRDPNDRRPDRPSIYPAHNKQQLVADLSRAFATG